MLYLFKNGLDGFGCHVWRIAVLFEYFLDDNAHLGLNRLSNSPAYRSVAFNRIYQLQRYSFLYLVTEYLYGKIVHFKS